MNKIIVGLILTSCTVFADKEEDLKIVLEKTYLDSSMEPMLYNAALLAMQAVPDSEKNVNYAELVQQFKECFHDEQLLAKLGAPFKAKFSEEEVHELRKVHENPVYTKYRQETGIFTDNFEVIMDVFKELASSSIPK